jgi:hypothetical protein
VARGDAACSEGSLMMVPSGAVRVLVATRQVDFRKGHGWPRRAGAGEPVCGLGSNEQISGVNEQIPGR